MAPVRTVSSNYSDSTCVRLTLQARNNRNAGKGTPYGSKKGRQEKADVSKCLFISAPQSLY